MRRKWDGGTEGWEKSKAVMKIKREGESVQGEGMRVG